MPLTDKAVGTDAIRLEVANNGTEYYCIAVVKVVYNKQESKTKKFQILIKEGLYENN